MLARGSGFPADGSSFLGRERTGWAHRAVFGIVFLTFVALTLHGIANYWQWGHDGCNGASFWQAARNSLRFGIVAQAQTHTGLESPEPGDIYTRHPLLLHAHLIAAQAVLGTDEWAGRLVPAAYSILTLLLLYTMARRFRGPRVALLSMILFAVTPVNLIYAHMINHEQGGIFWSLVTLYAYMRWIREGQKWFYLGALLSCLVVVNYDWPGYYLAFFIAVHSVWLGRREDTDPGHRRIRLIQGLSFLAVALANAGAFFGWISTIQGGLGGMGDSFLHRTGLPGGFFSTQFRWSLDLQGVLLLGLLVIWILGVVYRARQRIFRFIDLIPLAFLFIQLVHTLVFKNAANNHAYWTLYLSPAIAVGGALVLDGVYRRVSSSTDPGGRAKTAVALVVGCLLLAGQAAYAWDRLQWGFRTGGASYVNPYRDYHDRYLWARDLASRFPRGTVRYVADPAMYWRIEFAFYLDAPIEKSTNFLAGAADLPPGQHQVALFDLQSPDVSFTFQDLARQHRTLLWDRRFLAIEVTEPICGSQAFVSEAEPVPIWWDWLVNPRRRPVIWNPDSEGLSGFVRQDAILSEASVGGGADGAASIWICPKGHGIRGFNGRLVKNGSKTVVSALQTVCERIVPEAFHAETPLPLPPQPTRYLPGPWQGGKGVDIDFEAVCRTGDLVTGVYGRHGKFVTGLGLLCARPRIEMQGDGSFHLGTRGSYRMPIHGDTEGEVFESRCERGSAAAGLQGRFGAVVDAMGVICFTLPGTSQSTDPAVTARRRTPRRGLR